MSILNIPENIQTYTKSGTPGSTITIVARAKHGYEFDHWEDLSSGDPGYDSATRKYVIKPSGNDLVAKFKDKDLGYLTPIPTAQYSYGSGSINVGAPSAPGDFDVVINFDEAKEWVHEVRISGLNSDEYQLVSHDKYTVTIRVLAKALGKLYMLNVEFLDRFQNRIVAYFNPYRRRSYRVTAEYEGAEAPINLPITRRPEGDIEEGESVTLIAPQARGKRFVGWYENGHQIWSSNEMTVTINSNRNFTVRYENITYNNHFKVLTTYPIPERLRDNEGAVPEGEKYVFGYKVVSKGEFDRVNRLEDIMSQVNATYFTKIGRSIERLSDADQYVLLVPLDWIKVNTASTWGSSLEGIGSIGLNFTDTSNWFRVDDNSNEYTLYTFYDTNSTVEIGTSNTNGLAVSPEITELEE